MKPIVKKEFKTLLPAQEIYEGIKGIYPESSFLNSSYGRRGIMRQSYIGCDLFLKFRSRGNKSEIIEKSSVKKTSGNPLDALSRIIKSNKINIDSNEDFIAGGIGYFSYDLKNIIEKLPRSVLDDICVPDICFNFYKTILVICEGKPGKVTAYFSKPENDLEKRQKLLEEIFICGGAAVPAPFHFCVKKPVSNFTKAGYMAAVKKIKRYIKEGDIFQACLSQRFETVFKSDPWLLYKKLNLINPAPYSAYLDLKEFKILSSSPELFLKVGKGIIETKPMKGTINRGLNKIEDRVLKKKLKESSKDTAELLMIVDLERNDLGKICELGSVKVTRHRKIEKYASVFQTTSTVKGRLINPELDIEKIIRATFPGGSISGCPKIRAMEIIDEIEPTARGIYTGSIGYISFHKTMCLNMAIRIMIVKDNKVYFQVGGGIVADSKPESEYEETLTKAKALIESLS